MARGKNPKSLANLKAPIKPGEVRNPLGISSRKRPFSERYAELGNEIITETERRILNRRAGFTLHPLGTNRTDAAVRGLFHLAAKGDAPAIRELSDRIEGKAPRRLEITAGPQRVETTIVVRHDRRGKRYETHEEYQAAVAAEQAELAEARRIIAENAKMGRVQ